MELRGEGTGMYSRSLSHARAFQELYGPLFDPLATTPTCVAKACPSALQTTSGVQCTHLVSVDHPNGLPNCGGQSLLIGSTALTRKGSTGIPAVRWWENGIENLVLHSIKRSIHATLCMPTRSP